MSQKIVTRQIVRFMGLGFLFFLVLTGCISQNSPVEQNTSLLEARRSFKTVLTSKNIVREPVEIAPINLFQTIKYPAPNGDLAAYLSPDPSDSKKHPAIIWMVGGDSNSIGDVWSLAARNNDQTAAVFRKSGIVMMFPSLRGGNNNPGIKEGFLGEIDDVLAAAKYLEKQPYVDPKRIYLGGHSTGGTLALLVAESTDRFRGVFSFGPAHDVSIYGRDSGLLPFDLSNSKEVKLRSPIHWLKSIQSPTWVFEGSKGNAYSLQAMARVSDNPKVHFIEIKNRDHFDGLAPVNEMIAEKILQDTSEVSNISFSEEELNQALQK